MATTGPTLNDLSIGSLFLSLALLILLSAFFSGSETALMTINRYRLKHRARDGDRGAQKIERLLQRPDRLIGLILLGNNFVNILASSLATIIALRLGGEGAIPLAAALLTFVLLIFGEVTPKTMSALKPETMAYPSAWIYIPMLKLFYPIIWLVNLVTNSILRLLGFSTDHSSNSALSQEELRTVVHEAGHLIPHRHQKMLLGILDLDKGCVEDIMIPRNEIVAIDLNEPESEILHLLENTFYTRIPVYEDSIDNMLGFIHVRNLLRSILKEKSFNKELLRAALREPYFIPKGAPLHTQLINFQKEHHRIGLVVDEYGDVIGLMTLADLLEEIVGEFATDPNDSLPDVHPQDNGIYLVNGSANVRDLVRTMHWQLPTNGPKTLNGLILEYLESIPEPGTSLLLEGYPMEIVQIQGNAVKTVRVKPRLGSEK